MSLGRPTTPRGLVPTVAAFCALTLGGCPQSNDGLWTAFNQSGETLTIEVTASDTLGDPVTVELFSTTGTNRVADATVDPGSGPVGTEHQILVVIDDAYEEIVERVTVDASGTRGETTHLLRQDSADHGTWVISVTSLGETGETRSDTFEFHLWVPAEETDTAAVELD